MKEFEPPKKINVFGTEYKVKTRKDFEHMGLCHKDTKLIELEESLPSNDMRLTFLHEVFHAVVEELSLSEIIDDQLEEIICDNFSKMVCRIDEEQISTKRKAMAAKKKKKTKKTRKKKTKRKYGK